MVIREIEPIQLGLAGAMQIARLDKERTDKGKTAKTQMWLVTSRTAKELPPMALLNARRQEWGIENGLHYVLDVSGEEDRRLKVRTANSIWVLSLLTRLSVALWKSSRGKAQSYYTWRESQKANCRGLLKLMTTPCRKIQT